MRHLKFFVSNFLYWLLVFASSRVVFFLFQWNQAIELSGNNLWGSFWHGLQMDASFAGYISLAVALVITFAACFSAKQTARILNWLTAILLFIHASLTIADGELFKAWGFRLDNTAFLYLKNPDEAMASVPLLRLIFLLFLIPLLFWIWWKAYRMGVDRFLPKEKRAAWWNAPIFLCLGGMCIIPMRGGFDTATMNHGMVFFSSSSIANQAALNMPWNLMFSVANQNMFKKYEFMPDAEAERLAVDLWNEPDRSKNEVLNTKRPNIIIVLMESFSSLMIEKLGGQKGITPRFDAMTEEGLLFTNLYADGFRTERGLVAILSGYPSQTVKSVIRSNSRLNKLPMLAKDFKKQGYATAFYYGGDINFVNTRSYVVTAGFQRYTEKSDYPDAPKFNWGAHDEAVFEKMIQDLDQEKEPFFYSALTMSNHEPHTVPIPTVFEDRTWENSMYYADQCMGNFIDTAKKKSWWKNTLIIFVADHGVRFNYPNYDPNAFKIPMLWMGGALTTKNKKIETIGNQRDIATTLLTQLGMKTQSYKFSKNLLNQTKPGYALYTFVDGFGFIQKNTTVIFDNTTQSVVCQSDTNTKSLAKAQALFQLMNNDFLNLEKQK